MVADGFPLAVFSVCSMNLQKWSGWQLSIHNEHSGNKLEVITSLISIAGILELQTQNKQTNKHITAFGPSEYLSEIKKRVDIVQEHMTGAGGAGIGGWA